MAQAAGEKMRNMEENAEQQPAAIDEAVTQLIATLPRMFKTIKHQAHTGGGPGPAHDLGETQIWVLYALATGAQLTGELARRFNVTTPTITRMVDSLVEHGYVERRHDSEDRRRIYLKLTKAGAEVARHAHQQFRDSVTRFLSPLSAGQLADIVRACKHLQSLLPDEGYDYRGLCPIKNMEGMGISEETEIENDRD